VGSAESEGIETTVFMSLLAGKGMVELCLCHTYLRRQLKHAFLSHMQRAMALKGMFLWSTQRGLTKCISFDGFVCWGCHESVSSSGNFATYVIKADVLGRYRVNNGIGAVVFIRYAAHNCVCALRSGVLALRIVLMQMQP
jgi:hypothetical protein